MARSVVVTGGFGVLGHKVAETFLALGDKVARLDLAASAPVALEGALDLGGLDLTDEAAARAALDRVATAHDGLDVLVNVAGGFVWETFEGGSLASWARMHALNLTTAATVTQLALPRLRASKAGRIVNIGAAAALRAGAGMGPYAASKSGLHRLTEALAEELVGTTITVNAVLPSIIDTPANRADMPDADRSRWIEPAALADVIVFLASEGARAVSGALIPVTRGLRA